MATSLDLRQAVLRTALLMAGTAVNATADTILPLFDAQIQKLFEDRNFMLVDGGSLFLTTAGNSLSFGGTLSLILNSQAAGGTPTSIPLAVSTANFTADGRMLYAIINRIAGTSTIVDNASTLPSVVAANQEVVLIAKRSDAADGVKRVYFRNGFTLSAGQGARLNGVGIVYANEFIIADKTDPTKRLNSDISGATTGASTTLTFAPTGSRTLTFPDTTDTMVARATADTLSNKILAFLRQSVTTDSATTGAAATLAAITTGVVRLTNVSLTSVAGIPAGLSGQSLTIENQTGAAVTISNNDAGATAANRIFTGTGGSVTMQNNATFVFTYDTTQSRWMLTGGSGSGSGSTLNYITFGDAEAGTQGWATYSEVKTVTITNATPAVVSLTAHGYAIGQRLTFTTSGTLPTGLTANTTYFVSVVVNANSFQVATTLGGTSVATSSAGSGTHSVHTVDPVTGTGGSISGLTFATSSSAPLIGNNSYTLAQTNATVVNGQGVSYDFTIDSAYQARVLQVSFQYNASATFAAASGLPGSDSDVEVFLYDKTNATIVPLSGKVLVGNGANNFAYSGTFQTPPNSTSYRLIVHAASANANATGWTLKFDSVSVGPQIGTATGAIITDWVAYTPVFTGYGTVTGISFFSRRVGGDLEVHGTAICGTATAVPNKITMGFNGGSGNVTLDTARVTQGTALGIAASTTASTTYFGMNVLGGQTDLTVMQLAFQTSVAQSAISGAGVNVNTSILGNGTQFVLSGSFPIVGWSSNVQMSSDTDTRVVAASYKLNLGNITPGSGNQINFDTRLIDTHGAVTTGTGAWKFTAPVSGTYEIAVTSNGNAAGLISVYKNGVSFIPVTQTASGGPINSGSGLISLVAGDFIDARPDNASIFNTGSIHIARLSGPAVIAASESVNMSYTDTSGSAIGTSAATYTYATKNYDSHNAYSGGTYTCPVSGKYRVSATIVTAPVTLTTAQTVGINIFKNTTQMNAFFSYGNGTSQNYPTSISGTISCNAGDTITIRVNSAVATTTFTAASYNNVSIERVGN